ncbi:MAG: LysM peptidoglycan-binding domain-containing protein [Lachnospiraceae bacterium]|nr:LysM peptidoglycan-binding domain-containing protein [Lachnospiraceae bacterium]
MKSKSKTAIPYSSKKSLIKIKYIRKNQLKIRLTIAFTIILIFMLSIKVFASKIDTVNESATSTKYFKSVQIEKGDTLWSIATKNMDYNHYKNINSYLREIKNMNSLKSDNIISGTYIIIPYYSTESSPSINEDL